jgi:hypothetical protein
MTRQRVRLEIIKRPDDLHTFTVLPCRRIVEQTTGKVAESLAREGLLGAGYDQHDLRQAINDMNQRIRYAAGECDTPPSSIPLLP